MLPGRHICQADLLSLHPTALPFCTSGQHLNKLGACALRSCCCPVQDLCREPGSVLNDFGMEQEVSACTVTSKGQRSVLQMEKMVRDRLECHRQVH